MSAWDEVLDEAYAAVAKNPDGSVNTDDLRIQISKRMRFDADAEKDRLITNIINSGTKHGKTKADGQLTLPGFEAFPYEPHRLLRDIDGKRIVKTDTAQPPFILADSKRSNNNMLRVVRRAAIKNELQGQYSAWWVEQRQQGRKPRTLGFGKFLRETGVWSEGKPPKPDGDDGDDE